MPASAVVPILTGPSWGQRWIVGSSTNGCWLGTYEPRSQSLVEELARPGGVVWDIGANVGFLTLHFSRRVGGTGRVVAFEPLPRNVGYLRRHLELNGITNVDLAEMALGRSVGSARFVDSRGPSGGQISPAGELEVRVSTVDALLASGEFAPPSLIKMDIEGGELDALEGARETLQEHHPVVWIETHGWRVHEACRELLLASGCRLRREEGTAPAGWGLLVAG